MALDACMAIGSLNDMAMEHEEKICYFCKFAYHAGTDMIGWTCRLHGKKVESFDSCWDFENYKYSEKEKND